MITDGTRTNEIIDGSLGDDTLRGHEGNDLLRGYAGNDILDGGTEDDQLSGDVGVDQLFGGAGNDILTGGIIYTSGITDTLEGGDGNDTFLFQLWDDPDFASDGHVTINDFDPVRDKFAFVYFNPNDWAIRADPAQTFQPGDNAERDFYSGPASKANGESFVVINDQSFASASEAAAGVSGEAVGDTLVYFDNATRTAKLAYVLSPDQATAFAELTNVHSADELAALHLNGSHFVYDS